MKTCSCEGINENCYRCGGTGILGIGTGAFFGGPLTPGKCQIQTHEKPIDGSKTCRHCQRTVKSSRYRWHLENACRRSSRPQHRIITTNTLKRSFDVIRDLTIPNTTQEETRQSRLLDATREYAHAFREDGKYGSHSSHDRFDGDSNP